MSQIPTDESAVLSCKLANGVDIEIKHKTYAKITMGSSQILVKFYILPQLYLNVIIGCDILQQLGAIIDYEDKVISFMLNTTRSVGEVQKIGYLGTSATLSFNDNNSNKLINLRPESCQLINPKDSKRIKLQSDQSVNDKTFSNQTITVNEPVSIQFKLDHLTDRTMNNVTAVIRNDTCQPVCLLPSINLVTMKPNIAMIECANNDRTQSILNKIDLDQSDLDTTQKHEMRLLLKNFEDVFADHPSEIGCTNLLTYDIKLKDNVKPIRLRPYKTGWKARELIEQQVDEWVENGIIRPSMSEWSFPCLLVAKKGTDKQRLVVDMRQLNAHSEIPNYPLIDLEDFLGDLGSKQSKFYSTIDLKNAYLQVPLSERSQELCSFVCSKGQYSFLRAPFGLCALPMVFARLIDEVLRGTKHHFTQSFLDDILIYSNTFEEHIKHIQIVLERLRKAGLTVEPKKTKIARKKIVFIGYTFSKEGVETDPSNISKVKNFPKPLKIRDISSFLGLANYYRRFIEGYATIARPLNDLLKKKNTFKWTSEANLAFETLKEKLITAPILAYPDLDSDEPLTLITDASLFSSGYVLSQKQFDHVTGSLTERAISYGSRSFTETQQRYTVTERELLAVVFAVNKLDHYLRCKKFVIITDHSSLQWILSKSLSNINARLARWVLCLGQYNFTVIHRPGKSINNADAMSRIHCNNADEDISFAVEPYMNAILRSDKTNTKITPVEIISKMSLPGLTRCSIDNLRETQMNDYWYSALKIYLLTQELPLSKKLAEKVMNNYQDYIVINDVLYHLWSPKGSTEPIQQICITDDLKNLVWNAMHVVPNAGHQGIVKTYAKIRDRYFWPKMSSETSQFVQQCDVCAVANRGQQTKVPLVSLPVPIEPLNTIFMDILSIHTPSKGYKYILVLICAFSKYVIARPLKRKTSKLVSTTFLNHYILLFGIPTNLTIHQDNGGEFIGAFNKSLQKMLGIKNIFITPYSPASQGMVEKANRNILSILRRYTMKEPAQWSVYLPYVVLAINSAPTETAKRCPFELIHGLSVREPIDIQLPTLPKIVTRDEEIAHKYWHSHLKKIREIAKQNLIGAKRIQKRNYDRYAKPANYKLNDTVYLRKPTLGLTDDPKLRPMYKGPYTVHKFISPTNVALWNNKTKSLLPRSYHINKLKKIKSRKIVEKTLSKIHTDCHDHEQKQLENVNLQQDRYKHFDELPFSLNKQYHSDIAHRNEKITNTHREVSVTNESENDLLDAVDEQIMPPREPDPQKTEERVIMTRSKAKQVEKSLEEIVRQTEQPDTHEEIKASEKQLHNTESQWATDNRSNSAQQTTTDITNHKPNHTNIADVYHPVKRIHRKRHTPEGEIQYYVSWRNRPKKDNTWIPETHLSDSLQEKAKILKIPVTTQQSKNGGE